MKFFTFYFFVVLYFVATNINCDEKSTLIYSVQRTQFLDDVLMNIINKTNFFDNVLNVTNEKITNLELDDNSDGLLSNEEKGKNCLTNVSKCIKEDATYQKTTDKLFEFVSSSAPPFDLSQVSGVSPSCQRDSQKFVDDLKKFKLWALQMYDSTAKLPTGILNGNINQLGDFDMCLGSHLPERNIRGQYCLASLEIQTPYSPYLAGLHKLIQSHYHFRSKLEDPGHRVPRFSSINWALCVPNSCSPNDVQLGLQKAVIDLFEGTEIELRYEVNPTMCQTADGKEVPVSTIIALFIFGAIILVEIFATVYDNYAFGEKNKWITSFSFKKNFQELVTIKRAPGDIEAVHGIRMMNAVLLLLAHKSMALFFIPYVNRTECVEFLARPFTVLGRAASLYTDPFIMISGLLTSYSLLGKLNRTGTLNITREYVSRLYRIVPTFAALIAFCTFILPWLNDGPMWNTVITHHSDICKKYWWRNLLFIHNYFGFGDMCLTHTHHLGIDTQLFFTSPFLVYAIWKWPKKGTVGLTTLAIISTVARFYVTYSRRLSNYVHFGTSIQQLFATADNMYILPGHRATVYIIGIFLGYLLRNYRNLILTKAQLRLGNALAFCSLLISYLGPAFMGKINYVYDPVDAAWYAAVSPILWVGAFGWVIFTSQLGYKGFFGKLLSMPIWTLWTKISYTVYLTQFPIFFYNVGTTKSTQHYGFFTTLFNLQEYSWVIGCSMALCLVFEMPFQNIRSILLKNKEVASTKVKVDDSKKTL